MKLDIQAYFLYTGLVGEDSDFTSGMMVRHGKVLKELLGFFVLKTKIL